MTEKFVSVYNAMTYGDLIELLEPHKDKKLKFTGFTLPYGKDATGVEFYDGMKTLFSIKRNMGTTDIEVKIFENL